jgi:DNA polymerase I-like protein with 3'-5' exonuclease and polymerase domains
MEEREVRELIAKWKAAIPKTTSWQLATAKTAEQTGCLTTVFGRKRWFWTDSVYTESLSFLPQSAAADVIFRAMIGLYFNRINLCLESARLVTPHCEPLPKPALLVLQVHDSLLFEYPRAMREEIAGIVSRVMTQPWPELGGFRIPIGMKVGSLSWGELEPYEVK